MERRTFLTSASFGLIAGPSGTSSTSAADSARAAARRELVITQAGEPHSLDPHASTLATDCPALSTSLGGRRRPGGARRDRHRDAQPEEQEQFNLAESVALRPVIRD